jgi:hypothetical protein
MSKVAIVGDVLGTGTFTLKAPNGNTDRTLDLPDAGGTMVLDTSTQTLTNKTLTSPTLTTPNIDSAQVATVSGTAPIYMCRAWVNFNGTTSPGTIRASGNVSSVTRNSTGNYTVNFTTALPDTNYCPTQSLGATGAAYHIFRSISRTTSAFNFTTSYVTSFIGDATLQNSPENCVAIFR